MQEAQPLLIFPYNGNGVDVLDSIGSAYRFIGFVDDHNAEGRVDANRIFGSIRLPMCLALIGCKLLIIVAFASDTVWKRTGLSVVAQDA
jgi:hypothetical protein